MLMASIPAKAPLFYASLLYAVTGKAHVTRPVDFNEYLLHPDTRA